MDKTKQAWAMRANPHYENRMREFLHDDIVALGWPGLGDLAGKNRNQIRLNLGRAYGTTDARELGRNAGTLDSFVNGIAEGDYVIVPSPGSGNVYLGQFRGG